MDGASQEKVTKRKHTPRLRPALRAGSTGFAGFFDRTSLSCRKTRGVVPRALRA